jgi:ectoine hydroxylase-related dioxygenase (phytanoyl-CoA dioxygenase family)
VVIRQQHVLLAACESERVTERRLQAAAGEAGRCVVDNVVDDLLDPSVSDAVLQAGVVVQADPLEHA